MNEGNSEVFSKKLRSTSKCLNMLTEHSRGAWPVEGAAEDRLNVCVFPCVCGKRDYVGPVMRALLLEPERVRRRGGTRAGNKTLAIQMKHR